MEILHRKSYPPAAVLFGKISDDEIVHRIWNNQRMKNDLRKLAAALMTIATIFSITLAFQPNPSETQINLSRATTIIMVKAVTALLSLSDDDDPPE